MCFDLIILPRSFLRKNLLSNVVIVHNVIIIHMFFDFVRFFENFFQKVSSKQNYLLDIAFYYSRIH